MVFFQIKKLSFSGGEFFDNLPGNLVDHMKPSSGALFLLGFVSVSLEYLLDELQSHRILILFRGHDNTNYLDHIIPTKVRDYPKVTDYWTVFQDQGQITDPVLHNLNLYKYRKADQIQATPTCSETILILYLTSLK